MKSNDRMIAKVAARNVYLYGAPHIQSSQNMSLDEKLLEEARQTDRYKCSDEEMLKMLNAEYKIVQGQRMGGIMTSIRKARSIK